MQSISYNTNTVSQTRSVRAGAILSTTTSTVMTVLLLASMGQGFLSVALLAAAGLGFELLKWSSWRDAWQAHNHHQHDKRNLLAVLCAVAVVLSIGASVATTRSNLAVSATGYMDASDQKTLLQSQVKQKQAAIDVCTAANRITLCARPIQAEVSELQEQLNNLVVPAPDEATALILEVGKLSGLAFDQAATLVVALISIMLDASGLYFLFKQTEQEPVQIVPAVVSAPASIQARSTVEELHTHMHGDVNVSFNVGLDELTLKTLSAIRNGEIKPSVRSVQESFELPQHAAQTILYWLAESGHLEKGSAGRGYAFTGNQGKLI